MAAMPADVMPASVCWLVLQEDRNGTARYRPGSQSRLFSSSRKRISTRLFAFMAAFAEICNADHQFEATYVDGDLSDRSRPLDFAFPKACAGWTFLSVDR